MCNPHTNKHGGHCRTIALSAAQTLPAQQVRERFLLRHGRIGENFRFRLIGRTGHANAGDHVVFRGIRITNGFDVQQRLIRRSGEQQFAFTHDQILAVGMEAAFRDINLPVEAQPLFILSHFQIAGQTRFQTKGVEANVVAYMNRQVAVNRNTGALLLNRLQIFIQHDFVRRDPNGAFRHFIDDDSCPGHVNATIQVKQAWRGGKDDIWRNIQAHHRRHGYPHTAALRGNLRAPVVNLRPVGVTAERNMALAGIHRPL